MENPENFEISSSRLRAERSASELGVLAYIVFMTPAEKGELGEAAIYKALKRMGFAVFPEMGNSSKVDAIAMDTNGELYKIQIKATTSKNGVAQLNVKKCTLNPRYNYVYSHTDFDVFALYIEDRDIVAFIPSSILLSIRKTMTIRIDPAKRKDKITNNISAFLSFPKRG